MIIIIIIIIKSVTNNSDIVSEYQAAPQEEAQLWSAVSLWKSETRKHKDSEEGGISGA